jgi:hypothetical protein
MIIRTKHKPLNVDLKLVKKATKWYAEKLMSSRLTSKIKINLIFTENLHKETGCLAFCMWNDHNIRPKSFEIEIDAKLKKNELLKAVAHEMVHVKQYATCQVRDLIRENKTKWEGSTYKVNNAGSEEYWFSPWEVEAYGKEAGLYVMFMQDVKKEELAKRKRSVL